MQEAKDVLKKYYGYDEFREGQETIIEKILEGKDVLGIMPTGAGKSICYQIPAIIKTRSYNCNISADFSYEGSSGLFSGLRCKCCIC